MVNVAIFLYRRIKYAESISTQKRIDLKQGELSIR